MSIGQVEQMGIYVPTNFIFDVTTLNNIDNLNSPEFRELLVRLYQNINTICLALNLKETAYYLGPEFVSGKQFFPNPNDTTQQLRIGYRTGAIQFGALPNNGTLSVPHGINFTTNYSFYQVYGMANNPTALTAITLPYVTSSGTGGIQIEVTATNVVITTTGNYSAYTVNYLVLEYLKN